jgi:hypothetical protein
MPGPRRVFAAVLLFTLMGPALAAAESVAALSPVSQLRPEWTVEWTRTGRAHIVGYLYNDNDVMNAANVWLRVEQLTAAGPGARAYQRRVVGDVLSRGRMFFDVPVTEADEATYRVIVESVDWVGECR